MSEASFNNPDQNFLQFITSGEATFTWDGVSYSQELVVPHNLGYTPIPLVFLTYLNGDQRVYTSMPSLGFVSGAAASYGGYYFEYAVDDTNLYINATEINQLNGGSVDFKYFLLRDPAGKSS